VSTARNKEMESTRVEGAGSGERKIGMHED
jgi:hypothetical protein